MVLHHGLLDFELDLDLGLERGTRAGSLTRVRRIDRLWDNRLVPGDEVLIAIEITW